MNKTLCQCRVRSAQLCFLFIFLFSLPGQSHSGTIPFSSLIESRNKEIAESVKKPTSFSKARSRGLHLFFFVFLPPNVLNQRNRRPKRSLFCSKSNVNDIVFCRFRVGGCNIHAPWSPISRKQGLKEEWRRFCSENEHEVVSSICGKTQSICPFALSQWPKILIYKVIGSKSIKK